MSESLYVENQLSTSVNVTPHISGYWAIADVFAEIGELAAACLSGVAEVSAAADVLIEAEAEIGAIGTELKELEALWHEVDSVHDFFAFFRRLVKALKDIKSVYDKISHAGQELKAAADRIVTAIENLKSTILDSASTTVPAGSTVDVRDQSFWSSLLKPSAWANLAGYDTVTLSIIRTDDNSHIQVETTTDGKWTLNTDNSIVFTPESGVATPEPYLWHSQLSTPPPNPPSFVPNKNHSPCMTTYNNELFLTYGLGDKGYWTSFNGSRWTVPVHISAISTQSAIAICSFSHDGVSTSLYACWFNGSHFQMVTFSNTTTDSSNGHWTTDALCDSFNSTMQQFGSSNTGVAPSPSLTASSTSMLFSCIGLTNPAGTADTSVIRSVYFSMGSTIPEVFAETLPWSSDVVQTGSAPAICLTPQSNAASPRLHLIWSHQQPGESFGYFSNFKGAQQTVNTPDVLVGTFDFLRRVRPSYVVIEDKSMLCPVWLSGGYAPEEGMVARCLQSYTTTGEPGEFTAATPVYYWQAVDKYTKHRPAVAYFSGLVWVAWTDKDNDRDVYFSHGFPAESADPAYRPASAPALVY